MSSHYLFFEGKDTISLIDALKPRQRANAPKQRFDFTPRNEKSYGNLCFVVINDGQLTRVTGKPRESTKDNLPIYAVSDLVSARLVDFTSKNLEDGVNAFRADFYSPVRKEFFAYATSYGKSDFGIRMKKMKGLDLVMLPFVDYKIGDSVGRAIQSTFSTYSLALVSNDRFSKYQGRGLVLKVPAKLIERE